MPRKETWAPKSAVERLPLAVRKDLRDNWDSVKGEYEGKISAVLGKQYAINFNALEVYPYVEGTQGFVNTPLGKIFAGYAQCLADAVARFIEEYGEDGILHFNEAVSNGEFILNVNESGLEASVIGCDVKDGTYRILFRYDCLGYNQNTIYETMLSAIDTVPREGFPVEIKASIATYWDEGAEDVRQAIGEILAMPDVVIDPNFEENYAAMKGGNPDSVNWKEKFAKVALEYFNGGIKVQLERQGFKDDDLLQEGLAEALTSKTFKLRVVENMRKSGIHETFIEEGVCYIQTTVENWEHNLPYVGEGLVNLL